MIADGKISRKMKKITVVLLLSLYFQVSNGQTLKTSDITGKWTFTKYTETIKGNVVERAQVDRIDVYIFLANGTYQSSSRTGKAIYRSKGKWKVSGKGSKVRLYSNSDVPDLPDVEIADHDLEIKFQKGTFYLTYTSGDVLNGPRTDYFKKSK